MKKNNNGFVGLVILVLVGVLIFCVFFIEKKSTDYKSKCRVEGGTPVYSNGSINCAKEGYIDVRLSE